MAMHSDITNDTGSTATDTGRLRYCIREGAGPRRGRGVPGTESMLASMTEVDIEVSNERASLS